MKNKYIPRSAVAVVGSLGLLLATANAQDDNNKDQEGNGQTEKEERKDEKKEAKDEKRDDKREGKEDKREGKEDKREVKEDKREVKEDKREVKEDKRETKEDKREIKEDKRDAKDDKRETREDKREVKEDKMERREDRRDDKDFDTKKIVRFEDNDRKVILGYFDNHRGRDNGLPPGLVRRGKPLPAGWQSRIVSGYRIDDEWWGSFTPVPYDWFPNIRREPNTVLYFYGDRIVRVYEPRREVIDVIVIPGIRF